MQKQIRSIEAGAKQGLRELTRAAHLEWIDEAGRKLNTTRRRYQDSVQYTLEGPYRGVITLQAKDKGTQWLVLALERGVKGFDLKPGRLGKDNRPAYYWSKHATIVAAGKKKEPGDPYYQTPPFVDIPFRTKSKEQEKPDSYARLHSGSHGFRHPGFKPKGDGGPGPMRPAVIEYIKETAQDVLLTAIRKKITV